MNKQELPDHRHRLPLLLGVVALCATGCTVLRAGPGRHPTSFEYIGAGNAYASVEDLRPYNGDIIQLDFVDNSQQAGELINLDLWPIAGIGIGAVGLRVHIVTLGAGFGTLFYKPVAVHNRTGKTVHVEVDPE